MHGHNAFHFEFGLCLRNAMHMHSTLLGACVMCESVVLALHVTRELRALAPWVARQRTGGMDGISLLCKLTLVGTIIGCNC